MESLAFYSSSCRTSPYKSRITPASPIQVENHTGLLGKLRVAGKNPIFIPPWFDHICIQDSPDRTTTNRCSQCGACAVGHVCQRLATQRHLRLVDHLTRERFDHRGVPRGKNGAWSPGQVYRRAYSR